MKPEAAYCHVYYEEKILLKYFVESTEQLMIMMLLIGLIGAYAVKTIKDTGARIIGIATLCGFILSFIMTWFKTETNLIDTATWNLRNFTVSIIAFIFFILFAILKKQAEKKEKPLSFVIRILPSCMLGVQVVMLMVYYLTVFLENPHTILLTDSSVLSTSFLFKVIGCFFGLVLPYLAGLAVKSASIRLSAGTIVLLLVLANIVNFVKYLTNAIGVLLARRIIPSNHTLFVISKNAANYGDLFIFLTMLVCVFSLILLFLKSLHVNEPWTNPAEHRKIRAKWRNNRRWCVTGIVVFFLVLMNMTTISAYANREVELSPIEKVKIQDDALYIPFDQVNDGHLHRFGYTTDDGITLRMIVIQKPNSSAYGVGMDCCDICGETGYYEKEGQVICNRCDVVMNINTIGFKGGCNPKIVDYHIKDGHIIVPIQSMLQYKDDFKNVRTDVTTQQ